MIYTTMTKKALKICFNAHINQVDKTGVPYVFHPFHLAEQMDDENSVCVALLHDVVEDTSITFDELIKEGFNQDIISALKLLTHIDDTPYMDYVKVIKNNPLAKKVKLQVLLNEESPLILILPVVIYPVISCIGFSCVEANVSNILKISPLYV